jgi:thiosulfate/3-mercaptopyruvate sulfurtransferase
MRFIVKLVGISLAASISLFALGRAPVLGRPAAAGPAQASGGFQQAQLIEPAELVKQLNGPRASRPVILHVGFEVLFRGGHIPGAIHAGPASTAAGLRQLRQAAARIPRDREVVMYCGCCPMSKCPNIHPAYAALRKMGFRHLLVLDLPQDFARDWAEKGLPVAKGLASR